MRRFRGYLRGLPDERYSIVVALLALAAIVPVYMLLGMHPTSAIFVGSAVAFGIWLGAPARRGRQSAIRRLFARRSGRPS